MLRAGWYALCTSRQLGRAPVRVFFDGDAYVAWRAGACVSVLRDICPHRGAPLSAGAVREGALVCPYHGWRFGADGRCVHMPALGDDVVRAHAVGLEAREEGGIVWVRWGAAAPFARRALIDGGAVRLLSGEAETTLADMAENILDTTHTSIVHAGYLRGAHARRRVQPRVEVGDDWIEAHYPPAATPSGLVGGLIGGPRYEIVDRFRAPAIAEVEYRDGGVTQFAIQFHLSPAAAGSVSAVAVMSVPGRSLWSHAKLMALETMLKRVFAEDREMLGAVARNRAAFEASPALIAPQDLLRSGIESILRGEAPAAPARLPEIWV